MRRIARENAPWALAALAGCALLAWLGLKSFVWSDYESESRPAFEALVQGHLTAFLQLAPAYGGSLVERAPFALIPGLWGGGALAVYRAVAVPCLLAAALLGVHLVARMRAEGRPRFARVLALAVCVANPRSCSAPVCASPPSSSRRASGRCGQASRSAWPWPTRSGRCSRPVPCCSRCRHEGARR
jgi:hypothetical protein